MTAARTYRMRGSDYRECATEAACEAALVNGIPAGEVAGAGRRVPKRGPRCAAAAHRTRTRPTRWGARAAPRLRFDEPDVAGARALLRFLRSELDALAFAQQLENGAADGATME